MSGIKKLEESFDCDDSPQSFSLELKLKNDISNGQVEKLQLSEDIKKEFYKIEIIKEEICNESLPIKEIANTQLEKRFKCELCGTAFTQLGNLKRHIDNKHKGKPKSHVCQFCTKAFFESSDLKTHVSNVHGLRSSKKKELKCSNCDSTYKTQQSLDHHKAKSHGIVNRTFPCRKCDKIFDSQNFLDNHRRWNHINENDLVCKFCNLKYSSKPVLRLHIARKHTESKLTTKCHLCTKTFSDHTGLKYHMSSIHQGNRFKCDKCEKDFASKLIRLRHVRSIHDGIRYPCKLCDKIFKSDSQMIHHKKAAHGDKELVFECDACEKSFKDRNSVKRHKASKHEGKTYKCVLCPAVYANRSNVLHHTKLKHTGGAKEHNCSLCDKTCKDATTLKEHIAHIHHHMKYPCEICKKEFSTQRIATKHAKEKHSDYYKSKCNLCNKEFKDSTSVSRHKKNCHTDATSEYECTLCDRVYKSRKALFEHISVSHEGNKKECKFCNKAFGSLSGLIYHQQKFHEGVTYDCKNCNSIFSSKNGLKYHMDHQHYSNFPNKVHTIKPE